ncbi:MAG: DUF2911 domain-containing protein [Saprospiraceae bacterium]|nr:DUF2911 domain-containing protein [Saprospiraceae bacterium]MDZ4706698.1 DUF2911 domain-containing protein [Saprospiraceae bacterium]
MKNITFILMSTLLLACSTKDKDQTGHQHDPTEVTTESKKPKSPKTSAMAMVGGNHIHIDYSAPSVRGRQIFGGLVAYDEIWVAGAHKATSISFDKAVTIGDKKVPAGKYGFFTIPGKEKWIIILNKQWDMHLADDYQQSEDILRLEVTPEILETPVEMLTYTVNSTDGKNAVVSIAWDMIRISFEVRNV